MKASGAMMMSDGVSVDPMGLLDVTHIIGHSDADRLYARLPELHLRMRGWDAWPHPFVYFAERGGQIKIGTSKRVGARLRTLKATRLLAVKHGGRDLERQMHETFAPWALGGEWFEASPQLLRFISWLPLPEVPPPPPPTVRPMLRRYIETGVPIKSVAS